MSVERPKNPNRALDALRNIAEDPLLPQEVTLYAAKLIANEVVAREGDRGFSSQQVSDIRELATLHPELSGEEGMVGFNNFLNQQEHLALARRIPAEVLSEEPDGLTNFIERIVQPSSSSLWVSKQNWLPFRSKVANLMEDVKLSVLAPIVLARGIARQDGKDAGIMVATIEVGMPVLMGLMVTTMPIVLQTGESPLINSGVATAVLSYLAWGYRLYHPGSKNAASYRQELNHP